MFLASLALTLERGGLSGLMIACAALLFAVCTRRRRLSRQVLLCGCLSCLLATAAAGVYQERLEDWRALEGETVDFTGWVAEEDPFTPGRATVHAAVLRDGKSRPILLDLRDLGDSFLPGQWIAGRMLVLEAREEGDALGGVSLFGWSEGAAEPVQAPAGLHPFARLAALRRSLSQRVWEQKPGDPAGVAAAMVFSRQDLLSPESLSRMDRAGMRHLLVVSGLHLSIAAGWLQAACRRLGLGERAGGLLSLAGVWLLAGLAGFSVSALRAGVMTSLALLASVCWARADGLTSLGTAALLMALASPPVIFRAGFQLTFAATLGLLLGMGPLVILGRNLWEGRFGFMGRLPRRLLENFSSSLCAQLGAAPVLAAWFGCFSLWGLLTNLLALPLVMGILLLGGTGTALLAAGSGLASAGSFLLACARVLARGVLALAGFAAALPGGVVPVLLPWQLLLCGAVSAGALGWLLASLRLKRRHARLLLSAGLLSLLLSLGYAGLYYRGGTVVSASGRTGAVVISAPGGTVVLADGEGAYSRRMLLAQLGRCQAEGPLVLVCPRDAGINEVLGWQTALSPALTLAPAEELSLLRSQYPGEYRPLGTEPAEVLPGIRVSNPRPWLTCVETGGRKLLKSGAGYDIIRRSGDPLEGDLLVDMDGRVYPLAPELRPGTLPTGDTNLILRG